MLRIPRELKTEIQEQIVASSRRGESGWRFSHRDEDSLLGDYLGNLRTDKRKFIKGHGEYDWEILYHKLQGRGKNAYEKSTGADAVITFEIVNNVTKKRSVKSLIFQAKKEGNKAGLKNQKDLMDKIAKGGNFIFTCSENGYYAQTEIEGEKTNIGDFIAYKFIECKIGIDGFEYDEKNQLLINKGVHIEKVKFDEVKVRIEIKRDINQP
jgi:hypothetical protein